MRHCAVMQLRQRAEHRHIISATYSCLCLYLFKVTRLHTQTQRGKGGEGLGSWGKLWEGNSSQKAGGAACVRTGSGNNVCLVWYTKTVPAQSPVCSSMSQVKGEVCRDKAI